MAQLAALDRLSEATARLEEVLDNLATARAEWLAAMISARREGVSYQRLGEVAGISRQRVAELLKPFEH